MTKTKKGIVTDQQLSLFDYLQREQAERQAARPGRLNVRAQLDAAIRQAIRNAPKSREVIAEEMSDLAGTEITVGMINNWTAESHPHRIPGEFLSAFCVSTGCVEPLRILAEAAGVFTLPGPDALRSEIQRLDEEARKIQAEKRKRQVFLREMEGRDG